MAQVVSGQMDARDSRFALVVARFNDFITERLVAGARDALVRHGADPDRICEIRVPGAWELPLAVKKVAAGRKFAAILALGCVIRGQTPHFEYVAGEAAKGLATIGLKAGTPIGFGVVTADTLEQAIDRAGGKAGNKGADAALAAIEMIHVLRGIEKLED